MIVRRKSKISNSNSENQTIKAVEFPDKEFASKGELFNHLKANENKIISLKKATIKKSQNCSFPSLVEKQEEIKAVKDLEEGFIYPIINTTKYIDSHNDVHLNGIWNKSLKEQQGKIYYVSDHKLELNNVIAYPKDVEMQLKTFTFKDLGKNIEGETEALMFKVAIDKVVNEKALNVIENKTDIEHSVRMQYVKVFLALDSDLKEDAEYKKDFDKYINEISNKQVAIENGYFWGVSEAKIFKEGSMVLFGSNDATPLMQPKEEEP